jgi:hypothetical protein
MNMAFSPENSAIKLTPAQEKEVSQMLPDAMTEYFRNLAVEQGLGQRDHFNPDILIPMDHAQPTRFAKAVTIGGQKHILEANSEAELDTAEVALYRSLFGSEAATQPRDSQGRFMPAEDAAHDAELKLRLTRGEIDITQFMAESREATRYLDGYAREHLGIDPAKVRDQKFVRDWEGAVKTWLETDGADYQGGEANKKVLTDILAENNLQDAEDKIGALNAAYQFAKENGLLVDNPELKAHRDIASANDPESLRAAAARSIGLPERPDSSWTFGR